MTNSNRIQKTTGFGRAAAIMSTLVGLIAGVASSAHAGPLLDRIKSGEPIRIGYTAAAVPACIPGDGQVGGLTAELTYAVLKEMGNDKTVSVAVPDFGSLIPGLAAKRFDIAICGMYIRAERCKNVAFSNPQAAVSDLFVLPKGNPKGTKTWEDVVKQGSTVVFVQATVSRDDALAAGVDEAKLMAVPGSPELAAAITSGRADIGHLFAWDAGALVKAHPDKLELVDPGIAEKLNWSSNAFHHDDADFVQAYNVAQAKFMQTPDYMTILAKYGLDEKSVPEASVTAEWACKNRH